MRQCHCLGGIGDQITGYKRILHSRVYHCNSVTDGDRRKDDRCAACHCNAELDRFNKLVDVHMSRNDLVV